MTTSTAPRKVHDHRSGLVVSALEARGLVDAADRDEALDVVDGALAGHLFEPTTMRRRLSELAGYVGGALVAAAGVFFVADRWEDLSVPQQVGLLVAIGILLVAAAVTVGLTGGGMAALRSGVQPVRRRLASVLFTGGAAAVTAAVVVGLADVIQRRGTEMTQGPLIGMGASVAFVVLCGVGYVLAPTVLGQVGIAAGAAYAIPFTLDAIGDVEAVPTGLLFLALGLAWLVLAETGIWREVMVGRLVGAAFALIGAQIPVGSEQAWVGYLLTFLVALGGFGVYVTRHAWPYLAIGVVGVTLAVPEAVYDWTEGALGTAWVLLVAGVTLLGASLLGLRLRQEVTEPHDGEATGGTRAEGRAEHR